MTPVGGPAFPLPRAGLSRNLGAAPRFVLISSVIASLSLPATPGRAAAAPPRLPAANVVCGAPPPGPGAVFSGPVLHVFDGRTFCVAQGPSPTEWVRVTLVGEAHRATRATLMAAAFARRVRCQADRADRAGVAARCALDDAPLDLQLEDQTVRAEAAAWR